LVRMFWSRSASFAVVAFALGSLISGCSGGDTVQEALGYEQTGPDELAVIKRPPLIVPPDFNLRPPRADDPETTAREVSDAARETLTGTSVASADGASSAETANARAILTQSAEAEGSPAATSEGQNVLVSRTDRTELDLDKLAGTRAENRVDTELLRRLLAWTPEDQPATENPLVDINETDEAGPVVQVVSRSQTVIDIEGDPASKPAE